MNVYFISGLGADKRAFERLKLSDNFSIHYLNWIKPNKKESLNEYAKRLTVSIDQSKPFALVGLSMGGMIASSMTQFIHPYKTILISSTACAKEFPPFLKLARFTRLYKIIPEAILDKPNFMVYWMFGAKNKKEKELMQHIVLSADVSFIKWGIGAILSWKNNIRPQNVFHIHGSADKILPIKYTCADVVIQNGSHFMVWTKAGEVSRLLGQALR
jgi:pimeloyl-ACP methyl ester carboxylesterase